MLILCLKVFFARILDVSLGTIRTMFVVKGKRLNGALIGFFEVLIWFLVVREALQTGVDNIFVAVSYASGFAIGTYIGGFLSSILITGKIGVQVFTGSKDLIEVLRDKNYAVSVIECHGYNETDKYMLYINIDKKRERELRNIIKENDKNAFIVENETNLVVNGYFK